MNLLNRINFSIKKTEGSNW